MVLGLPGGIQTKASGLAFDMAHQPGLAEPHATSPKDYSRYNHTITFKGAGEPDWVWNGRLWVMSYDGGDDYAACGDIGKVRAIVFWVKSSSANEVVMDLGAGELHHNGFPRLLATTQVIPTVYRNGVAITFGSDLVTYGDCENDSNAPSMPTAGDSRGTAGRSDEQKHGGSYSYKFTGDGSSIGGHYLHTYDTHLAVISLNTLYYVEVWVYLPSGQTTSELSLRIYFDAESILDKITVTNTWVKLSGYFYPTGDGLNFTFVRDNNDAAHSEHWYVDDWVVKEVTSPVAADTWTQIIILTDVEIDVSDLDLGRVESVYGETQIALPRCSRRAVDALKLYTAEKWWFGA